MTTYTGTQAVEPGLYVNTRNLRVTSMEVRGPLPGADTVRYRRVPMLVMLASAPLLGLVFVIFLPFIGFAVMLRLLGEKAMQVVAPSAREAVEAVKRTNTTAVVADAEQNAARVDRDAS